MNEQLQVNNCVSQLHAHLHKMRCS